MHNYYALRSPDAPPRKYHDVTMARVMAELRACEERCHKIRTAHLSSAVRFFHVMENTYKEYRADFRFRTVRFRPYDRKNYRTLNENLPPPVKYTKSIKFIMEPKPEFTEVESKVNIEKTQNQKLLEALEECKKHKAIDYPPEYYRFSRSNLKKVNLELCPPIEILELLHRHYESIKYPDRVELPRKIVNVFRGEPIEEEIIKITYPESTEELDRQYEAIFLQEVAERRRHCTKTSSTSLEKRGVKKVPHSVDIARKAEESPDITIGLPLIESSSHCIPKQLMLIRSLTDISFTSELSECDIYSLKNSTKTSEESDITLNHSDLYTYSVQEILSVKSTTDMKETPNSSKPNLTIQKTTHSLQSSAKIAKETEKSSNQSIDKKTSSSIGSSADMKKSANSTKRTVNIKKLTPSVKCSTSIKETTNPSKQKVDIKKGIHAIQIAAKITKEIVKSSSQIIDKKTSSSIGSSPDTKETANSSKRIIDIKRVTKKCSTSIKESANPSKQKVNLKKGIHSRQSSAKIATEIGRSSNQSIAKKVTASSIESSSKENDDLKNTTPSSNIYQMSNYTPGQIINEEKRKPVIVVTPSKYILTESDHKLLKYYDKFLKLNHPSLTIVNPVTTNPTTSNLAQKGKKKLQSGGSDRRRDSKKFSGKNKPVTKKRKKHVVFIDLPEKEPLDEVLYAEFCYKRHYHDRCTNLTLERVNDELRCPTITPLRKLMLKKALEVEFEVIDIERHLELIGAYKEPEPRSSTQSKKDDDPNRKPSQHVTFILPPKKKGAKKKKKEETTRKSCAQSWRKNKKDPPPPPPPSILKKANYNVGIEPLNSKKTKTILRGKNAEEPKMHANQGLEYDPTDVIFKLISPSSILKKGNDGVKTETLNSKQFKIILPEKNMEKPEDEIKPANQDFEKRIKHHDISTKLSFVDIMYELKCPSTTALRKKILHKALEVQYGVENIPLFEETMKLFSPTSSRMRIVRDVDYLNKNHNYDNVLRLARSRHAQFYFSQRTKEVEGLSPEDVDLEELDINPLVIKIFFLGDQDDKYPQMLHYYKKINSFLKRKYQKQENEAKVESIFERDTSNDIDVNLDPLAWPSLENLARGLPQPVEYQHHDLSSDDSLESIESNKEPLVEAELEKKSKFCDLARLFFEESEEIKLERKEKFCDISILLFKDHLPSQLTDGIEVLHRRRSSSTDDIEVLHRRSSSSNEPPCHRPLVKPTLEHCNLHDPGFYTPSVEIVCVYARNDFKPKSSNSQIDCPQNVCSSKSKIDRPLHLTPIVIKPKRQRHQVDKNKSDESLVKVTNLTKKGRKQKDVIQDDPIKNITVIRNITSQLSRSSLFGKIDLHANDRLPLPRDFHPKENTTSSCFKYHHNLMAAIEIGRQIGKFDKNLFKIL